MDADIAHAVKTRKDIAKEYGVSLSALHRHMRHALKAAGVVVNVRLRRNQPVEKGVWKGAQVSGKPNASFNAQVHAGLDRMLAGSGLQSEVQALRKRTDALAMQAEASGDARTALLAIRELTRLLDLQGRMVLEASAGRAQDVSTHPVWHELAGAIMHAIQPCDACSARVQALIHERLGQPS